jgi:hypothetical protein
MAPVQPGRLPAKDFKTQIKSKRWASSCQSTRAGTVKLYFLAKRVELIATVISSCRHIIAPRDMQTAHSELALYA